MPRASITFMVYSLSFAAQLLSRRLCKCCLPHNKHSLIKITIFALRHNIIQDLRGMSTMTYRLPPMTELCFALYRQVLDVAMKPRALKYILWKPKHELCYIAALRKSRCHTSKTYCQHLCCSAEFISVTL